MKDNMNQIIDYAIKSKRFCGGLGKLKKDGSIVKLNGQIYSRKKTKDGKDAIVIDNFFGRQRKGTNKRWQMVLVDNLVALHENKWQHTKVK